MEVRRLDADGRIRFRGSPNTQITRLLANEPVGLELFEEDSWRLFYGAVLLGVIVARNRTVKLVTGADDISRGLIRAVVMRAIRTRRRAATEYAEHAERKLGMGRRNLIGREDIGPWVITRNDF
jgi:hypothetical protein